MEYRVIQTGNNLRTSVGALGASAVTLIQSNGENILVDVGHYGRRRLMLEALSKNNISIEDINIVVLTHLHWDHALNIDLFKKARIFVSKYELEYNQNIGSDDPFTIRNFGKLVESKDLLEVDGDYKINSEVTLLDSRGHTHGHLAVVAGAPENGIVVTGDSIPNLRAWHRNRPDIVMLDEGKAEKSIERIKKLGYKVIVPGHDPPFKVERDGVQFMSTEEIGVTYREDRERDFTMRFNEVQAKNSYM